MDTPQSSSHRWSRRALCTLGLAIAAMAAWVGSANAYVSPAQAEHATDRGAGWFEANQEESGSLGFGGDWGMTALAAADVNAADVSTSLADPSAQDFYLDEWQVGGPGGLATDAERGILAGVAGGIQTSRLSTSGDTTTSNLVARVAELFDGDQIGDAGLFNDDIFGVLALHQVGAPQELLQWTVDYLRPQQLPNGGWSWSATFPVADTDMTGAALAAFCAAGVSTSDPDVQEALGLLHSLQDPATGGFIAPAPFGIGVNTDTTSWVASGLIQCGINPQGPEWTTDQGKTPFDYLLSQQHPDGHFSWTDEFDGSAFETYSSVRPLGGAAFSSEPPARLDGVSPAVHPAPDVANGTTVPIALVIDHGPGADDVRMCRIDVETGASLEQALEDAEGSSTPAGCVAEFAAQTSGGSVHVSSLNGVAETADYGWRARIGGSSPQTEVTEPVGFGDLVFLELAPKVANPSAPPEVEVPALKKGKRHKNRGPRVAVLRRAGWQQSNVAVRLRCPRGNGAGGCRGVLTIQFRKNRGTGLVAGGSTGFEVASGNADVIEVPATAALREALARRQKVKLRVAAATRAEDGAVRLTHARRFIAG